MVINYHRMFIALLFTIRFTLIYQLTAKIYNHSQLTYLLVRNSCKLQAEVRKAMQNRLLCKHVPVSLKCTHLS